MQPSMKNDVSDRYLAIFAQYYADIDAAESTSDRRVAGGGGQLAGGVVSILNSSNKGSKMPLWHCLLNGRLLVRSFYRSNVAVASYIRN